MALAHPGSVEHEAADPYTQIVRALERQDPRFVRRVSAPADGLGVADLMVLTGLFATILLGVIPLALGLQASASALVGLGAAGCLLLPVGAPVAVRAVLRRRRPLRH